MPEIQPPDHIDLDGSPATDAMPDPRASEKQHFHLGDFDGPLDLLLFLIRKSEVNIYDIPIASITEQYLSYLNIATKVDLSDAVAVKGKPVAASASVSIGASPLPGVTVKVLTQQRTKNVNIWVNVGSAVTGSGGVATISIPAKSITMDQQLIKAIFVGDDTYGGSADTATVHRQ